MASTRLACRACRKIKASCPRNPAHKQTRCIHDGDPPDTNVPCLRCVRLKLDCDFSREQRGRKTNSVRLALRNKSQVEPLSGRHIRQDIEMLNDETDMTSDGDAGGLTPMNPSSSRPGIPTLDVTQSFGQADYQHLGQPSRETNRYSTSGTTNNNPSASTVDVSEILDPASHERAQSRHARFDSDQTTQSTLPESDKGNGQLRLVFEDPIELDFLSLAEARALVKMFHQHLNPSLALLDPQLHTCEYLRQSSSILFTAVLAATSKFFRQELHDPLTQHAHSILNRATNAGQSSVGIVQALLILVYWKRPTDRSGWLKVGMAIRMAFQMGWHRPETRMLPSDELSARKIVDAERTWYCIVCFDRTYSMICNLPLTVLEHQIGDPQSWALEHLYLGTSAIDMHLAASIEMPDGHAFNFEFRRASANVSQSPALALSLIEFMMEGLRMHAKKWLSPDGDFTHPSLSVLPAEAAVLDWWSLTAMMELQSKRVELLTHGQSQTAIVQWLELAGRCTERIETLTDGAQLLYLQDAGSVSLSTLGKLTSKMFWRLTAQQKMYALTMIQRVMKCCQRIADGNSTAVTAFAARFLHRILRDISSSPRITSRAHSPADSRPLEDVQGSGNEDRTRFFTQSDVGLNNNGQSVLGNDGFNFELDASTLSYLDNFFMTAETSPTMALSDDQLYWSSFMG